MYRVYGEAGGWGKIEWLFDIAKEHSCNGTIARVVIFET